MLPMAESPKLRFETKFDTYSRAFIGRFRSHDRCFTILFFLFLRIACDLARSWQIIYAAAASFAPIPAIELEDIKERETKENPYHPKTLVLIWS